MKNINSEIVAAEKEKYALVCHNGRMGFREKYPRNIFSFNRWKTGKIHPELDSTIS